MAPLLQCRDVRVAFPQKGWGKPAVEVLKGVTLEVNRGETVGLVGESGSGKTTLGRAVLGFAPVTGGQIVLDGTTTRMSLSPSARTWPASSRSSSRTRTPSSTRR